MLPPAWGHVLKRPDGIRHILCHALPPAWGHVLKREPPPRSASSPRVAPRVGACIETDHLQGRKRTDCRCPPRGGMY